MRPFNFTSPILNHHIHVVYDDICGFYEQCFSASEIKVSITHASSMCFNLNQYFKGFTLLFKLKFFFTHPSQIKKILIKHILFKMSTNQCNHLRIMFL